MPSYGPRRITSCSTPRVEAERGGMMKTAPRCSLGLVALLTTAAALSILPAASEAQCAMCRTALTGSPEGRAIGEQFNRAILLMMAAPYVVIGTVGAVFFRERLRSAIHR